MVALALLVSFGALACGDEGDSTVASSGDVGEKDATSTTDAAGDTGGQPAPADTEPTPSTPNGDEPLGMRLELGEWEVRAPARYEPFRQETDFESPYGESVSTGQIRDPDTGDVVLIAVHDGVQYELGDYRSGVSASEARLPSRSRLFTGTEELGEIRTNVVAWEPGVGVVIFLNSTDLDTEALANLAYELHVGRTTTS